MSIRLGANERCSICAKQIKRTPARREKISAHHSLTKAKNLNGANFCENIFQPLKTPMTKDSSKGSKDLFYQVVNGADKIYLSSKLI